MQVIFLFAVIISFISQGACYPSQEDKSNLIGNIFPESFLENIGLTFKGVLNNPRIPYKVKEFKVREKDIQSLQIEMNWFIDLLKTFIDGKSIDTQGFKSLIDRLDNQLSYIGQLFEAAAPVNERLSDQHTYAKKMFYFMVICTRILGTYSIDDGKDQALIYKVIKLNLRVLVLFDAHGAPDPKISGYKQILDRLNRNLKKWKIQFENLTGVSSVSEIEYQIMFSQAERALKFLELFLPRDEVI